MKFQNPNIHGFYDMAGIRKRDERTDEPTDKQRQTNMPHQLFQSWGHKKEGSSSNAF